MDHGKIYLSEHLMSACARLGISVQPARVYQATDKAALERFFRTLGEQLLAALPGYKGPDVYRRGKDPEQQAFYFLHELEQIDPPVDRGVLPPAAAQRAVRARGARPGGVARWRCSPTGSRGPVTCRSPPAPTWRSTSWRPSGAPSSTTGWRSAGCATTARR